MDVRKTHNVVSINEFDFKNISTVFKCLILKIMMDKKIAKLKSYSIQYLFQSSHACNDYMVQNLIKKNLAHALECLLCMQMISENGMHGLPLILPSYFNNTITF